MSKETATGDAPSIAAVEPDAVAAVVAAPSSDEFSRPISGEDDGAPPIDEAAESAFLAEARARGETVPRIPPANADAAEPVADAKALPALDDLVKRIPPEVRETLEDLFRARFVAVKRVPKRTLK